MHVDTPLVLALVFVARTMLGVLFLRSAWGKFADVPGFARGLAAYQLLPAWAIAPLAWLLPLTELALAAAFLIGWLLPLAAALAGLLLAGFTAALVVNLRRGRVIACNCHGSSQHTPISWGLVARNTLLVGLALLLVTLAPAHALPAAVVGQWQHEAALLLSWAALPMLMLVGCFITCSLLLATLIDTRHAVQQVV